WAGDSRVYRQRGGKLEQLTQDHAMVEDMVEVGLLTREEAENHPQANRITRAVGAAADLFVDIDIFELKAGDRFLLCSDGLYKEVNEPEISALLKDKKQDNPARAAVDLALSRNARDNVTVITVDINNS
ncbi:MAG: serine/threonine-protein phosphatase, partial [Gammaproteobacteria bacterium]|nr:serine/threonine-protein phosphatase [Gammaproteobacteria bacterium]